MALPEPHQLTEKCLCAISSLAKRIVDERLELDAKPGNDMMQSHIQNRLNRKELMVEVFLTL
jgi:hypothetical protein